MVNDQNRLPSIDEGELWAEQQLKPDLELHLVGLKNALHILSITIEAVPPMNLDQVSSSKKIATALLVKIANDLRANAILTSKGYAIQAATIAASLYEFAFMIAYIGDDEDLANKWIEHSDLTHNIVSIKEMTLNALKKLGAPNPEEECEKEYKVYKDLCMIKHGNPNFQKAHSFIIENNSVIASPGPMTTDEFIKVSWYTIENAVSLARIALGSFINHQLKTNATDEIINKYNDLKNLYNHLNSLGFNKYGDSSR